LTDRHLQDEGPEHLAYLFNEAATFNLDAGHYEGAKLLYRRALEVRERVFGKEHPDTLISVNNLAFLLMKKRGLCEYGAAFFPCPGGP
jgi:hypothetical protein